MATECALELCTNIYSPEVIEGKLSEGLLKSSIHRDMDSLVPNGTLPERTEMWNRNITQNSLYCERPKVPHNDLRLFIPDNEAANYRMLSSTARTFNVSDITLQT